MKPYAADDGLPVLASPQGSCELCDEGGPDVFSTLDDALLVRIVQNFGTARARARLAATSVRFSCAVDASWNSLMVCSPREAPLAWTARLLRERELAFLEELTLHVSPEERGERCQSLVLRSVAALRRADLRTSLLTPALLRRLGQAAALQSLELELPDALCAAGPVTLGELASLKALQRLSVTTKWSVRTSNSTVVALAAGLSALTSLTSLVVCGANVFSVETPAAAEALLGRLATLWIGTLRTRCTLASPSVTTLTLACTREDEWRVGYLPGCLEATIRLREMFRTTALGWRGLPALRALTLELGPDSEARTIGEQVVAELVSLENLEVLTMRGWTRGPVVTLAALAPLRRLTSLQISFLEDGPVRLELSPELSALTALKCMELLPCSETGWRWASAPLALPALTKLQLSATFFHDPIVSASLVALEVFEEYAACRDFPVVINSPRLHTLTARTVSGISEAQITAVPTLTGLRRVMVRLGRDGLGNSLAFGGRTDDVTRLLAALASLRPARDCGISACVVAITRAVELPAAVLRRFHDLVLACRTLTVPDAPDVPTGTVYGTAEGPGEDQGEPGEAERACDKRAHAAGTPAESLAESLAAFDGRELPGGAVLLAQEAPLQTYVYLASCMAGPLPMADYFTEYAGGRSLLRFDYDPELPVCNLPLGVSIAERDERHYDEVDLAMTDAYGDDWADEEDAFDDEP
ncbi:hypothetical protein WJX81_002127 [Elliptochloris bilobata]|uniref:F-box domain-containing protein n=1 Tax=Elliptochloris bilobata TaxID=381761 RepID=A0AAW1RIX0_9CHLO